MEITLRQQIYYSNKEPIPVKEVAQALIALEGIILQSPFVLEAMFPGTKIQSIEIYIDELKSDSLWEDIVIKFIFGDMQQLDKFIVNTRDRLGMDDIMNNPQLFSAILLVMILTGGAYYLGKRKSASGAPDQKAVIEANNNTIIQIGAGMSGLDADYFKEVINSAIKDKDKLAKDAIQLIKPAKRDPAATITLNSNEELKINSESVKAMPSYIEDPEEEQDITDFKDLELEIRATDLDSTKKGWKVNIPELNSRRIRMQLDPSVSPEELGNKRSIKANVTVVFGYDKEGNKKPNLVFLREINNQ